ncbi:MAG: phosphate acetyltransferase [Candidatus Woesearchaeota archaeon]
MVKKNKKRIVFPEGEEDRIIDACKILIEENLIEPVLIGNHDIIKSKINERNFDAKIIDNNHLNEKYANQIYELRKNKGLNEEEAKNLSKNNIYYGTMMLYNDEVHGLVAGSTTSTSDTLRPALQLIKTKENIKTASSFFIMIKDKKKYFFADCGFNIKPNSKQLAEIAYSTAISAKEFNIEPKIAFLSFSSKGSANNEEVDKVKEAVKFFDEMKTGFVFDGELQLDAAIVPHVCEKKCMDSSIKGDANILIFPDLNSGNIGYKIAQWIGGSIAIGPIVQGLNKPVNDLSRGCNVEDIVAVALITAIQSMEK